MKALAISDTHIENVEQLIWLQHVLMPFISDVDVILHAGDAIIPEVADHLSSLRPTHLVRGECDLPPMQWSLPRTEVVQVGQYMIGIAHARLGLEEIADLMTVDFSQVDAIVYGHTHEPFVGKLREVLLINPGSPTHPDASPRNSVAVIDAGGPLSARIVDVIRPVPNN
ncbi:MAG: YfcE family phosphodiesterase [Actinobacteria bacterium]|nr:MAG: YfcE family phosphodiesterase [Actinomycetota bacterium]